MKREQKIQEILFEGKQNDLSPSIEWLAKGLSNSWVEYSPQKSDFESLYAQASKNSSKILSFSDFTKINSFGEFQRQRYFFLQLH